MLNFSEFEKILEELEKEDLFNQFIINLLDYDIKDLDNLIIRYKIDKGLIIDIFDYKEDNKFTRYYFTNDKKSEFINNDVIEKTISLKECYINFDKNNKYSIFSLIFYENDISIIKNNLSNLFNYKINNIIMKHLKN